MSGETLLHLGLGIEAQRIVHVNKDLIEYDRQLAHLGEG